MSVDVRYFSARGVNVTTTTGPAGGGGSDTFVWDQQQLAAVPTSFVFAPSAPQLEVRTAATAAATAAAKAAGAGIMGPVASNTTLNPFVSACLPILVLPALV